ncbi:MAG: helix-turn-helix domain-containing protein [Solirubrobacteraceae bacterium]
MRYANDAEIEQQIRVFGANMRAARKRANMTQTDLAAVDGLDRAAISLTEKGKRSPDMRTLLRIAHGVRATPAELVQGIGNHESSSAGNTRVARHGQSNGNGFGANLLQARQRVGLSQQMLGARAEVDAAAISLYERGQREPNLRTILKLARTLQMSPAQLLRGIR